MELKNETFVREREREERERRERESRVRKQTISQSLLLNYYHL